MTYAHPVTHTQLIGGITDFFASAVVINIVNINIVNINIVNININININNINIINILTPRIRYSSYCSCSVTEKQDVMVLVPVMAWWSARRPT